MPFMTTDTDTFSITPISPIDLQDRLNRRTERSRYSKGSKIVTKFLDGEAAAVSVKTKDVVERNKVIASCKSYIASSQGDNVTVWAKASTPTEILLVNLTKADAATKTAYKNRPRVGRKSKATIKR